jgi:hypothetical protein
LSTRHISCIAEVLESRAAQQEVGGAVGEGHFGSTALPEVDVYPRSAAFLPASSTTRWRNNPGPRDLKHAASGRELAGDAPRKLGGFIERFAGVGRVPLRDHTFHADVFMRFGKRWYHTSMNACQGLEVR